MKKQILRTVTIITALMLAFFIIAASRRAVMAAPAEPTEQANFQGAAEQLTYELWLMTLAETVDQAAFAEELADWKGLYAETGRSWTDYLGKGAAYTAAQVNTAARKVEAGALNALQKLIQTAKASIDEASQSGTGESDAIAKYRDAINQFLEKFGSIEGSGDVYDLETGYLAVMTRLDNAINEKQAAVEAAQALEEAAKADAENANTIYLAGKAESDAAFEALKEAVNRVVEASFLLPEGEYYIFNGSGGNTVIDITDGSVNNGATARLYNYSKIDAQRFSVIHNNDGTVTLLNANSGKALDAAGRGILNGTDVRQYTANGSAAQKWVVEDSDNDGLYTIKASYCPLVIDTKGGSDKSGANVELHAEDGHASQEWRFADPAGVYFTDVTAPSAWYYKSVYWAFANHITSGYGKDTFRPNVNVTRAQVVQFFYNLAGKPSIEGLQAVGFTDVAETAWYYEAVTWAASVQLTSGYGPETFQPDTACNRAMIASFLRKYAGYIGQDTEVQDIAQFTDVKESDWFYEAVTWAAEQGISSGYGEGTFRPYAPCSRAMMVAFFERADAAWNA